MTKERLREMQKEIQKSPESIKILKSFNLDFWLKMFDLTREEYCFSEETPYRSDYNGTKEN